MSGMSWPLAETVQTYSSTWSFSPAGTIRGPWRELPMPGSPISLCGSPRGPARGGGLPAQGEAGAGRVPGVAAAW